MIYYALAMVAAVRFARRKPAAGVAEPVSLLKPLRGRDAGFWAAIRSHAELDYPPGFEILFGVGDSADPAIEEIAHLQRQFPNVSIRMIDTGNDAPNGKVGSLEILTRQARFSLLVLNDSDILVEPDYLQRVVGGLSQENVGLVTCLYRGHGTSFPAKMEALGVATEFAPSVLVAGMLSASAFAFGSTIALRRQDLESVGGFAAIRNYLADDFQLGARVAALGKRVVLSDQVVETSLGDGDWQAVWRHQVRWSRTIRVSNPVGYFGYLVTQLTFWCLVAAVAGQWEVALAGLVLRMTAAEVATIVLADELSGGMLWAVPFRDLFGTAVWAAGITGSTVEWRGLRFRLRKDGTISRLP